MEFFLTGIGLIELSCEIPADSWKKEENTTVTTSNSSSTSCATVTPNSGILKRLESMAEIGNSLGSLFKEEESPYMFCSILLEYSQVKANGLKWMTENILENIP